MALRHTGGTAIIVDGDCPTLTVDGGTVYYQGAGTITNLIVNANGTLRFSAALVGRTVTNAKIATGGKVSDPLSTVTWTNAPVLNAAGSPVPFPDF